MPAMYYVGCAFNWFFVLLCLGGYFYTLSKTGKRWVFWPIFAAAWAVFGASYLVLIIGDVSSGEWYITLIRTIAYVLVTATLFTLIAELIKAKQKKG